MAPSKVTKKRSDSSKHPIQYWDGKTYACLACKRGHRVKLCDHGKDGKLVSATNQPGRPSSGSDRKCTCPKSCKCTTNCKCVKDGCLCVQKMFLVVALKSRPKPVWINQDPEPIPEWVDENGEQKTLNPVYTDLNGNILSPEQAKAREEERERRRNDPPKSCCSSNVKEETPAPTPGCRHRETVPQTPAPKAKPNKCTCGVKCQCTLCPEHPNNSATRQYNAEQLNTMASNPASYMPTQSMNGQLFKPAVPQGSCLGGEASYFLSREQPTLHDFQRLFPDYASGDFVLTYPMDAPTHTYNQMNPVELAFNTFDPMPLPDLPELPNESFDEMAFMDQPLNFTFGEADVTTFGNQPLQSPRLQSPMQVQASPLGSCCQPRQMIPPDTSTSINPDIPKTQTPYFSHPSLHSTPSLTHVDHNIFFDNTLVSESFDAHSLVTNYSTPQGLNYMQSQPQAHPLSPPGR